MAEFRKRALALPEAQEKSHFGKADFRVKSKIFAGLTNVPGRAYVKLTPTEQCALLDEDPDAFSLAEGAWGRSGWTYLALSQVSSAKLQSLLRTAYDLVATTPKKRKKA